MSLLNHVKQVARDLGLNPVGTIRSMMASEELKIGGTLLGIAVSFRAIAHLIWWLATPNASFGLLGSLSSWAGYALYVVAWAAALWFLSKSKASFASVLNGVAATQVIPALVIPVLYLIPDAWSGLESLLRQGEAAYRWLGLCLVARRLADGDDVATFRLILFSALSAQLVSIIWNAIF